MIRMTDQAWDDICRVNKEVNDSTQYKTDMDLYGKLEYWEPSKGLQGDCEDYALEKRYRLYKMGYDIKDLRLATCWVEGPQGQIGEGGYHAVLLINLDIGTYCLDNRAWDPILWNKFPYRWHKVLVNNNEWREIGK